MPFRPWPKYTMDSRQVQMFVTQTLNNALDLLCGCQRSMFSPSRDTVTRHSKHTGEISVSDCEKHITYGLSRKLSKAHLCLQLAESPSSSDLIFFLIKVILAPHIVQYPPAFTTALLSIKVRQYHALSILPLLLSKS